MTQTIHCYACDRVVFGIINETKLEEFFKVGRNTFEIFDA